MLQWMRQAQAWVIKGVLLAVVLAFVVTIFYQWGVRSSGGGPTRSVATIFGQPVNIREFQRVHNGLQQRYRAIFRAQSDMDLNERSNVREMAPEHLAKRASLLRLAQEAGISARAPCPLPQLQLRPGKEPGVPAPGSPIVRRFDSGPRHHHFNLKIGGRSEPLRSVRTAPASIGARTPISAPHWLVPAWS